MAKVPAFGELGGTAKDVLYGQKDGVFQYDRVINISSTTADGVNFGIKALTKGDKVNIDLKSVYTAPRYTVVTSVTPEGRLAAALTVKSLAPGLTLAASGTLPDPESLKVAVDYAVPHVTVKSLVSLAAQPKIDLAATTGYEAVTVGGTATFDSAKSAVTKWTAGIGYTAADYQVTALLTDTQDAKLLVAHRVLPSTTLGAEVSRNLGSSDTKFAVAAAKRCPSGALSKVKLENSGVLSLLYEQSLQPNASVALSTQINALDLNAAPKFGVGFNVKY